MNLPISLPIVGFAYSFDKSGTTHFRRKPVKNSDWPVHALVRAEDALSHTEAELRAAVASRDARIAQLEAALNEIVGIPQKMDGGDWDEIEQAQEIALAALSPLLARIDAAIAPTSSSGEVE